MRVPSNVGSLEYLWHLQSESSWAMWSQQLLSLTWLGTGLSTSSPCVLCPSGSSWQSLLLNTWISKTNHPKRRRKRKVPQSTRGTKWAWKKCRFPKFCLKDKYKELLRNQRLIRWSALPQLNKRQWQPSRNKWNLAFQTLLSLQIYQLS